MKQVGSFSIDNGILSGPAAYMQAKGNVKLDAILAGDDVAFNMTFDLSPDIETAILVHMQTDYAGWIGVERLLRAVYGEERVR